jgi:hypothetical protein
VIGRYLLRDGRRFTVFQIRAGRLWLRGDVAAVLTPAQFRALITTGEARFLGR